jgi:hypothetical protein
VVVLPPQDEDVKFPHEEFGDDDIRATDKQNQGPPLVSVVRTPRL